jgi:hypothetical protein
MEAVPPPSAHWHAIHFPCSDRVRDDDKDGKGRMTIRQTMTPVTGRGDLFRSRAITVALAVAGTAAFWVLGLPLPFLFGPLVACLVAALAGAPLSNLGVVSVGARTILGVAVGASLTPDVVARLPQMAVSVALVPVFIAVIGLGRGALLPQGLPLRLGDELVRGDARRADGHGDLRGRGGRRRARAQPDPRDARPDHRDAGAAHPDFRLRRHARQPDRRPGLRTADPRDAHHGAAAIIGWKLANASACSARRSWGR